MFDFLEDTIIAYDIKLLEYDNLGKAKFSWKSNTTGVFLKEHVFNVSIIIENDTIVQQKNNLQNKEVSFLGLDKNSNYTFIIQSKNKYSYSKRLEFKILAFGETPSYYVDQQFLYSCHIYLNTNYV